MWKAYFAGLKATELPIFAMALFAFVFALVLVRTLVYRQKADFDPLAALPLADEKPVTTDTHEGSK